MNPRGDMERMEGNGMNIGLKVALASSFGAIMGLFVGLSIGYNFWCAVLGLIVGGLIGYSTYEWKKVVAAAPVAWETAQEQVSDHLELLPSWRTSAKLFAVSQGIAFNMWLVFVPLVRWAILPKYCLVAWLFVAGICSAFMSLMASVLFITHAFEPDSERRIREHSMAMGAFVYPYFWVWTVPRGIISLIIKVAKAMPATLKAAGKVATFIGEFLWALFLLVNSEPRLVSGLSAMIGVVVGFCFGRHWYSIVAGGLAGGIVGFGIVEILSIRILHLIPRSQSIFSR
jgi:hypothetical protein